MGRAATVEAWLRRERLLLGLIAAAGGVVAILETLDLSLPAVVAATALGIGVAIRVIVALGRRSAEWRREKVTLDGLLWVPICSVDEIDPIEIGVDAAAQDMLPGGPVPEYQARRADGELDEALHAAFAGSGPWMVVVQGPTTVGKSRTLFEALLRLNAESEDLTLIAPTDGDALLALLEQVRPHRPRRPQPVVWLDDLEVFVATGVNLRTLRTWHERGAIVVATYGGKGNDFVDGTEAARIGALADRIVQQARRVGLRATGADELTQLSAGLSTADRETVAEYGLAAALVAAPALEWKLESQVHRAGEPRSPEGAAAVYAAADWARCGRTDPIPRGRLRHLWAAHLRGVPATDEMFELALAWALRPVAGSISLLSGTEAFRANDYIVGAIAKAADASPPSEAWHQALDTEETRQAFTVGGAAFRAGRLEDAERAWMLAAERGDLDVAAGANVNLGVLWQSQGRLAEAEAVLRRGGDRLTANGWANLGVVLLQRGNMDEAEPATRRAIEMGLVGAASNLGVLLDLKGDVKGAEAAFRQATAPGDDANAFSNFGLFLERQGRIDEAERCFHEAERLERSGKEA